MKVPQINTTNLFVSSPRSVSSKASFKAVHCLPPDTFEINRTDVYKNALNKLHKITPKEYDTLSENEKVALRSKATSTIFLKQSLLDKNSIVMLHDFAAQSIKTCLDDKYGAGNYVVIPIGRSMSSISKSLALELGEENVKNIPMSAMARFYDKNLNGKDGVEEFKELKGFKGYVKYLEEMGLCLEKTHDSGRKYVVMDYSASGMSLNSAGHILKKLDIFDEGAVEEVSLNDVLKTAKAKDDGSKSTAVFLENLLFSSAFKPLAFVGKMNSDFTNIGTAKDYEKFYKDSEKSLELRKLFGFCLLDNAFCGL